MHSLSSLVRALYLRYSEGLVIEVGDWGAIAPPGKFHQGKTHQNRVRSGNDFHKKMTKAPKNDNLHEVFVLQK